MYFVNILHEHSHHVSPNQRRVEEILPAYSARFVVHFAAFYVALIVWTLTNFGDNFLEALRGYNSTAKTVVQDKRNSESDEPKKLMQIEAFAKHNLEKITMFELILVHASCRWLYSAGHLNYKQQGCGDDKMRNSGARWNTNKNWLSQNERNLFRFIWIVAVTWLSNGALIFNIYPSTK